MRNVVEDKVLRSRAIAAFIGIVALGMAFAAQSQEIAPADLEFFETQIRPILAENCFKCHGPDKQESGMRLDHIETVLLGGSRGPALVVNQPDASRLIEAIQYGNVDLQMPPTGKLSEAEITNLREWIRRGAPWPDEPLPSASRVEEAFDIASRRDTHWAWQPIQSVAPPKVGNAAWSDQPIDQFILAGLDAAGLSPAESADKRTIVRRLYFDLIGLPPTPDEVHAFINDDAPDAYERMVDSLLASPHFGERWGRHWLDLVRYSETYGHEGDYIIKEAWKYRDYVIRAVNSDLPYPQLVREHIAGDLLTDPRQNPETGLNDSIVATGFWFMHQATHGPVDVAQDEADRIDNQIDVFGKAFLGMTVACARCHDHKFDAISAQDYYALTGFMRSTRQEFAYVDPNNAIAQGADHISALRKKGNAELREALAGSAARAGEEVTQYLQAAHEAINGMWQASDGPVALRPEVVFEDFEADRFDRWEVTGTAFDQSPSNGAYDGQQPINGVRGDQLANSFFDGDKTTGKLVSQPFLIEREFIRFLIGGGNHATKTSINLKVDDKVVRRAHGQNRESLDLYSWDVSEYAGQTGVIEIVDDHTGNWGHINVDHIVFTDSPFLKTLKRPLTTMASQFEVDDKRLARWIDVLQDSRVSRSDHPVHAWSAILDNASADESIADRLKPFTENTTSNDAYTQFETFERGSYEDLGWFTSGEAFGQAPTAPGDWIQTDALETAPSHTAHSGAIDKKLKGTLRSPTFTIEHDAIHYRAAGHRGRIRLVISQFQLRESNGLLFEDTLSDINTDGRYEWTTQTRGIGTHKGQQAYIELIDDGSGFVAIDSIWFSDDLAPPTSTNPVTQRVTDALENADEDYVRIASQAVGAAATKAFKNSSRGDDKDGLGGLARWLVQDNLIDIDDTRTDLATFEADARAIADALPAPERILAATDGTPIEAHVFHRGNHKNPGDETPRRFLAALDENPKPVKGGSARLELAERLLSPDNPLPARVMTNRVWHHIFGRGIVPSVDNFGVLGEAPTHPALLDYLAQSFVDNDWSLKSLIRDMVTSKTYRMSSARTDSDAELKDPSNALLHRMRVKRLESEVIRDSILAASGSLDKTMYGKSVPIYLSPFMSNHRRPKNSGPEDGERRRTIYVQVRRNYLSPMQLAFDFPSPDTTTGKRTRSNVPAQALIMMNDPFVVEEARRWGERSAALEDDDPDSRIDHLFEMAIGRSPSDAESAQLSGLLVEQAATYGIDEEDILGDAQLWADICHTLFTLKEFIFVG
jgi:hypothetical protein